MQVHHLIRLELERLSPSMVGISEVITIFDWWGHPYNQLSWLPSNSNALSYFRSLVIGPVDIIIDMVNLRNVMVEEALGINSTKRDRGMLCLKVTFYLFWCCLSFMLLFLSCFMIRFYITIVFKFFFCFRGYLLMKNKIGRAVVQ